METSRRGKIARLPREVREQLNRRLANGERGKLLVAWLNGLAEVQAVLTAEFGGNAIREQNLSEWKQGGYPDWLRQQEALEVARQLSADAGEIDGTGPTPLTDRMATWLTARYVVAARKLAAAGGEPEFAKLREFCSDLVALRRGDHYAERLKLDRARLEFERQESPEQFEKRCREWLARPENREKFYGPELSLEERTQRMRALFGML
jgi:hypothetical protein